MKGKLNLNGLENSADAIDGHLKSENERAHLPKRISQHLSEFSSNTTIQGVKYIGEKHRHWTERLCWSITFFFSITICLYLVVMTWIQWRNFPILISFARKSTSISEIPFPAVTVCPETKFLDGDHDYMEALATFWSAEKGDVTNSTELLMQLGDLSVICNNKMLADDKIRRNTTDLATIERLLEIAPDFMRVVKECIACYDRSFFPVLTEEGLCFTYNMLHDKELYTKAASHPRKLNVRISNRTGLSRFDKFLYGSKDWSPDYGYKTRRNNYPVPATYPKKFGGFRLMLNSPRNKYCCDRLPTQGFKVVFHHPAEVPSVLTQYIRVARGMRVDVSIKPDLTSTSDDLRSYDPAVRQCYFSNERPLQFYQVYTQRNCHVECLANFTLKLCGCVPYYMPGEDSTNICGVGMINCAKNVERLLSITEESVKLSEEVNEAVALMYGFSETPYYPNCDCLPSCTSLNYNAEVSQAKLEFSTSYPARTETPYSEDSEEEDGHPFSYINIFLKHQHFNKVERTSLYSFPQFIAECGGLLGLFVGFSFVSLVEIFYYLTLRPMCNIREY